MKEKILLYGPYYTKLTEQMNVTKDCSRVLKEKGLLRTLMSRDSEFDCLGTKLGHAVNTMKDIEHLREVLFDYVNQAGIIDKKIAYIISQLPNSGKSEIIQFLTNAHLSKIELFLPRLAPEISQMLKMHSKAATIDGYIFIERILAFPKLQINPGSLFVEKPFSLIYYFNGFVEDLYAAIPPEIFQLSFILSFVLFIQMILIILSYRKSSFI